jgi:hypothetical protein
VAEWTGSTCGNGLWRPFLAEITSLLEDRLPVSTLAVQAGRTMQYQDLYSVRR